MLSRQGMVLLRLLQSARLTSLCHWHIVDHMVSHPHYSIVNFLIVHFLHLLERSSVLFVHTCHWIINSRIKSLSVSHYHFVPLVLLPFLSYNLILFVHTRKIHCMLIGKPQLISRFRKHKIEKLSLHFPYDHYIMACLYLFFAPSKIWFCSN